MSCLEQGMVFKKYKDSLQVKNTCRHNFISVAILLLILSEDVIRMLFFFHLLFIDY